MRRPFAFALALHIAVLLLMFVVLPTWPEKRSGLNDPIVVEMVPAEQPRAPADRADEGRPAPAVKPAPVRPTPPSPRPAMTAEAPPSEPEVKSPPPPAPPSRLEPMRATRPKPKAEAPPRAEPKAPADRAAVDDAAPPKIQARAEPKQPVRPESRVEPKPESKPEAKPQAKPEAKPAQPETKPEPKSDTADFATVGRTVKDLQQRPRAAGAAAPAPPKPAPAAEDGDFATQMSKALRGNAAGGAVASAPSAAATTGGGNSLPITTGEIDSVRRQIEQCWSLPANVKPTKDLVVEIRVEMNQDGTPRSALIQDNGRMGADAAYRATAESARRAVLNPRCHPFRLPREKYDRWRTLTLVFNPAEMFRT